LVTEAQRARTLARYEEHRRAWESNEALRVQYAAWYAKVAERLPDPGLGPFIEIGSGPGFARSFIPGLKLSDIVRAPWHDHEISADRLPFSDGSVGALVLCDVLHHLAEPARFFEEATRVLVGGGRIVLCEPYLSPLSFPVYRFLHEEQMVLGVDPLAASVENLSGQPQPREQGREQGQEQGQEQKQEQKQEKDPFDSNQAIPTLLFDRARGRAAFSKRFPALTMGAVERLAGLSYPASGGFGRAPLLPMRVWRTLFSIERRLPHWAYRLIAFRMLVVLEKRKK
jgi:SAM-dependent methyltransferase